MSLLSPVCFVILYVYFCNVSPSFYRREIFLGPGLFRLLQIFPIFKREKLWEKSCLFWKITVSLGVIDLFHFELLWVFKQYFFWEEERFLYMCTYQVLSQWNFAIFSFKDFYTSKRTSTQDLLLFLGYVKFKSRKLGSRKLITKVNLGFCEFD